MKEIDAILIDATVVACFLAALFILDVLAVKLFPPEGPIFFRHTAFEFPLQWMIDAAHIGTSLRFWFGL
jgi:hypothetical protein